MFATKSYRIGLVPGPTSVPEDIRKAYLTDYGSSDLEDEFFALLAENENLLQKLLNTKNRVTIQSGEGMLVLWGAIKSALRPGDKVLAISNGLFGDGFTDMARAVGADARLLRAPEGDFVTEDQIRAAMEEYKPDMVTCVHCETPSGLLNPVGMVGKIVREYGALFCVDFVASAGGAPVLVDEWGIDLGLLGSQKCLSLLPDLSMLSVSEKAWKKAEEVNYIGYDALLPWKDVYEKKVMPYTHNWQANAALSIALKKLFAEGAEACFGRHAKVAQYCRDRVREIGLELFAKNEELASPTVTAVKIPNGMTWEELDAKLRERGVVVGGTWGDLAGKIFRIGHMGSQANLELVKTALDELEKIVK